MLLRLLICLGATVIASPHWSEQDENDRISAIMAAEKRQFDEEMKNQERARYRNEYRASYGGDSMSDQEEYDRRYRGRGSGRGRTTTTEQPSYGERYVGSNGHFAEALSSSRESSRQSDNWCYFCASPLSMLSSNSRKAVQQFLDIRRTSFSKDTMTRECISPKNFSALQKQECKHRFCQTLVLIDNEEGASFVMRGCAEHFGAVNLEMLEQREDNSCKRLHDKLDIRECICRERKSCYSGRERSSSSLQSALPIVILLFIYRLI
ncbi:hypothetical protein PMAYCL1PPCAC_01777, partial [Pristionchus mayeri]